MLYNYQEELLKLIGLSNVIPFDELEDTLSQFKVNDGLILQYPVSIRFQAGISMWQIKSIFISTQDQRVIKFRNTVYEIARLCDCHPALVLSFFLCGEPYSESDIDILVDAKQISINLFSDNLTTEAVKRVFSIARSLVGKKVRRRSISKRVDELIHFIDEHHYGSKPWSWNNLLKRWNAKYPKWKYKRTESMEVVYSRAYSMRYKQKKELEEEDLSAKLLEKSEQFPNWEGWSIG